MTSRRPSSTTSAPQRVLAVGVLAAVAGLLPGCPDTMQQTIDAGTDARMGVVRCSALDDSDRDGISNTTTSRTATRTAMARPTRTTRTRTATESSMRSRRVTRTARPPRSTRIGT
jgi:hypothetical protein